tara:strand:- start:347 stop:823 length:477 start_codon:yes stop_codon:yes gene_type:complete
MSKPFEHVSKGCGLINDVRGCETLDDAIVDSESIGLRLLRYVEAEDLLFVFCETVESFGDVLFSSPLEVPSFDDPDDIAANRNNPNAKRSKESTTNPSAIVFCKIESANAFKKFFRSEQKKCTKDRYRYEVSWSEFQELKYAFHRVHLSLLNVDERNR